jgi:hypothetical protein
LFFQLFLITSCSGSPTPSKIISAEEYDSLYKVDNILNHPFNSVYDATLIALKKIGYDPKCYDLEKNTSATIVAEKFAIDKKSVAASLITGGLIGLLWQANQAQDLSTIKISLAKQTSTNTKVSIILFNNCQPVNNHNLVENILGIIEKESK